MAAHLASKTLGKAGTNAATRPLGCVDARTNRERRGKVKVLIGCEESGICREEWRKAGHDAWSCDLIESRIPGQHIKGDVTTAIYQQNWDIIFCFYPCTCLTFSGNRWYAKGKPGYLKRIEAIAWTLREWAKIKKLARIGAGFENPMGALSGHERHTQKIQPWMFGHGEVKGTCLWLDRLPRLCATHANHDLFCEPEPMERDQRIWKMAPGPNRQRDRSETYSGIAKAMCLQWGNL